jgi:lactobin A/cerein 7B family class IIb bacteriocin
MVLKETELKQIQGGVSAWAVIGIISLGIFIVGVVDGFTRPLKCN